MSRLVLIISGPSGVGKSTLLGELPREEFYFSISHTTRDPRPGEIHGRDYYFISKETFLDMLQRGEFLEWVEVHSHYYGTAKSEVDRAFSQGKHLLLDVEVFGAARLKGKFGPQAVSVFIAPPNLESLKERLEHRGTESEDKIKERLQRASLELAFLPFFDYVIVNDDLNKAKAVLLSIVRAELCKPWRLTLNF